MKLKNCVRSTFVATAILAAVTSGNESAQAFSISSSPAPAGSSVVDFESATLNSTVNGFSSGLASYSASPGSDGIVVQGNDLSFPEPLYRAPSSGATGKYLSIGSFGGSTADVTINLATTAQYFGLLWGSIDTYNEVEFFNNGISVGLFTGANVAALLGVGVDADAERFVSFASQNSGEFFNSVVLRSLAGTGIGIGPIAFESDNHTFQQAIPTPALLPGLIALGVGMVRKRKAEASAESEA